MPDIDFTLDGRALQAREGDTIWAAAARHGVDIPHLCHTQGLAPEGNCRACVVEVQGERTLTASCCRAVTAGMHVQSQSDRAVAAQSMVVSMLASDAGQASAIHAKDSELTRWSAKLGITKLPARATVVAGSSFSARW